MIMFITEFILLHVTENILLAWFLKQKGIVADKATTILFILAISASNMFASHVWPLEYRAFHLFFVGGFIIMYYFDIKSYKKFHRYLVSLYHLLKWIVFVILLDVSLLIATGVQPDYTNQFDVIKFSLCAYLYRALVLFIIKIIKRRLTK